MSDELRKALAVIDKHSVNTIQTNSKDRGDWAEDMAYVGKVAREALAAAQPPAAMPGWQWVPVEPTKPMLLAGAVSDCGPDEDGVHRLEPWLKALWTDMLTAAPTAQARSVPATGAQPPKLEP